MAVALYLAAVCLASSCSLAPTLEKTRGGCFVPGCCLFGLLLTGANSREKTCGRVRKLQHCPPFSVHQLLCLTWHKTYICYEKDIASKFCENSRVSCLKNKRGFLAKFRVLQSKHFMCHNWIVLLKIFCFREKYYYLLTVQPFALLNKVNILKILYFFEKNWLKQFIIYLFSV